MATTPKVDGNGNPLKPESRESFLMRYIATCYDRGADYYISKVSFKLNGYDALMVVTRTNFETRQSSVAFIGARDIKGCLDKFYGTFGSGDITWRDDRYNEDRNGS